MKTQTVADTNAGTKSQTEDTSAQEPSIDELLKQFEETDTPEQKQPQKIGADDIKEVVSFVREDREARIREKTETDIQAAVKNVKSDLDLDDGLVRDLLYGKANTDPRFLKAFQMRHENPTGWESVQKAFHKELRTKLVKTDQDATDDRAAVEAAVRSASTGSPEEPTPDFGSMSDAEFNAWQRKNIR